MRALDCNVQPRRGGLQACEQGWLKDLPSLPRGWGWGGAAPLARDGKVRDAANFSPSRAWTQVDSSGGQCRP